MMNKEVSHKPFMSESGDTYLIPVSQYEAETKAYRAAVERGDWKTAMKYEEGRTGWRFN